MILGKGVTYGNGELGSRTRRQPDGPLRSGATYLVRLCIVEQLADVFASQDAGLDSPSDPSAHPDGTHHAQERYQGHPWRWLCGRIGRDAGQRKTQGKKKVGRE